MKKVLLVFALITTVSIMFFTSCTKETSSQESTQKDENNPIMGLDEFQESIIFGISHLAKNESLLIWKKESKYDWDVVENRDSQNQVSVRDHDCEGNGIKFVKCVKQLIDDGNCVHVGQDSDGGYWGDIVDCP